ncbi:hypothetical protein [Candidatus Entotheonella palauensis]|uniref:hypothetical protein n=1 Tax=Candidatus Entotheonella palauensis TaxID=93172 RepID=UPI000B7EFF3C|nr:hypothetical protein [Candidatus Entotheonella palauensis]
MRKNRLRLPSDTRTGETESQAEPIDVGILSVDLLVQRIIRTHAREGETAQRALRALLGLDAEWSHVWPSQSDVALWVEVSRGRVGQLVGKFQQRWSREPAITKLRADVVDLLQAAGGVMSVMELSEAVLMARGSTEDEPYRTKLAIAVTRAVVEVERLMTEPRFVVRRDGEHVLVTTHQALADYASRLGRCADQLADEDPLATPGRVLQQLRAVPLPFDASPLSDMRLLRLAVAVSRHAALSSRQELYPRGMDAARALKLSQGALLGVSPLNAAKIRERVSSRYPDAISLPDRPELDDLLRDAGFDFVWDTNAEQGRGSYVSQLSETVLVTSGSESIGRISTAIGSLAVREITPEIADARQFEERLQRAIQDRTFLVLMAYPKYYQRAREELCRRFPVQLVDFEALLINAMRDVAEKAKVDWDLVLKTDATPNGGDWSKLMLLIDRAMMLVEEELRSAHTTILLVYPGLLARYDRMDLLERLRDQVGSRDGMPGLWLLLPGQHQAMIDGKPVPILGPGQRVNIPETWLQNLHRSNANGDSPL